MAKVTTTELEHMIRKTIQEKGLSADITNERIKEIKEAIKSKISGIASPKVSPGASSKEDVVDVPAEVPTETPGTIPSAVTSTTSVDPKASDVARKEDELAQKEDEVSRREAQVANKTSELQRKQDELAYQPQIPSILENIGPEKVFIFDQNEMSLGAEALSKTNFRMISNPDNKKSMNDLWLESGIRKAEVFIVKFEKLGDVNFDPFRGTSSFEEQKSGLLDTPECQMGASSMATSSPETNLAIGVDNNGLTPQQAVQSQEASPMRDAVEPVKDVTLPMTQDMGLDSVDMQSVIDKKVEEILRNYLSNKEQNDITLQGKAAVDYLKM